jgi:excisionase family DNA binding protein
VKTGVDGDTLYTVKQAAQGKGVNYHTVLRAVRRGTLPARRLGRQVLITATDLTAWQPMYSHAPRKSRRGPDPTAENAALPLAVIERVVLEQRVVTMALTAARGVSLVNLRALADGLAALVEDLAERPDRQQGDEEDAAPPDRANPGAT